MGDEINAQQSQGFIHSPTAPVTQNYYYTSQSARPAQESEAIRQYLELFNTMPTDTLPPHSPLPKGSIVPSRLGTFVGREPDMLKMAAALKGGQTTAISQAATVHGMGGVGKTSVATEFVHRYGAYFAGGVFWLSFTEPQNIPTEIARCGGEKGLQLRPDFHTIPLSEQVDAVQRAWNEEIPRLLVFDNVDGDDAETLIAQYRPKTGRSHVLITTRRGVWDATLGITPLPLGVLPRAKSIALLQQFRPDLSDADADVLAKELGDLPLALHLAGSFLNKYARTEEGNPATFLARLRDPALLEHPALQGRAAGAAWSYHEKSVARAFALSYERLRPDDKTDAIALALLARAAHFALGEPIPTPLLLATVEAEDELQVIDAMERLTSLGLVETETDNTTTLHRLLARFVQCTTQDEGAQSVVEQVMISTLFELDMKAIPESLLPILPHLRHITSVALDRGDATAATLANNLAVLLQAQGDYGGARPLCECALAIREQVLGPHHPGTAASLNNLAALLKAQGDYGGARPLYERALAISEQVLGPHHPGTAASLNNLAWLLKDQGDYGGARPLYERALAIREQVLGPHHPHTAHSLNNLAALLKDQGDYGGARPLYERALAIREQVLGPHHPDTKKVRDSLQRLIRKMGE